MIYYLLSLRTWDFVNSAYAPRRPLQTFIREHNKDVLTEIVFNQQSWSTKKCEISCIPKITRLLILHYGPLNISLDLVTHPRACTTYFDVLLDDVPFTQIFYRTFQTFY